MSRLFEALNHSADGAFVIGEDLRIVYCNKAAEAILGFDKEDVVGQYCYQLLRGYDDGSHQVCKARCQVARMVLNSKPVPNYDIHVMTNYGVKRWMNISVFSYQMGNTNGNKMIVHLFHNLNHKKVSEKIRIEMVGVLNHIPEASPKNATEIGPSLEALTRRESEILTLLAKGQGTQDIASFLSISQNTVRNHIQHILQKFQVHTRLEAVTFALKHDLIG